MHHQIQPKIDPLVCVERSVSAQAATVIKNQVVHNDQDCS